MKTLKELLQNEKYFTDKTIELRIIPNIKRWLTQKGQEIDEQYITTNSATHADLLVGAKITIRGLIDEL